MSLPAQSDVAVIGGGIIGASTALFLARQGVSVTLCEKGRIGGEQSSRNWGWCRSMGRDAREIPLAVESLRLWQQMDALTGGQTGFVACGIVNLGASDRELAAQQTWLEAARRHQIATRELAAADIAALVPGSPRRWAGAVLTPGDGRAEPAAATEAIAAAAVRHGATVLTGCAVRGLDTVGGRVAGVITERGRLAAASVVLAGGAWSRLLCGNHGLDLPQLSVLGSVLRTAPLSGLPEISVGGPDFAFRKRRDGGYTVARRGASVTDITPDSFRLFGDFAPALIHDWRELRLRLGRRFITEWRIPRRFALDATTPFERMRVLDPAPVGRLLDAGRRNLVRAFPGFADMVVAETWAGLMDVTPDAVPVIGPAAVLPGLFLATGFSGHGFGIGPGAGRLMADLITGHAPLVDPAPFRLGRFRRSADLVRAG